MAIPQLVPEQVSDNFDTKESLKRNIFSFLTDTPTAQSTLQEHSTIVGMEIDESIIQPTTSNTRKRKRGNKIPETSPEMINLLHDIYNTTFTQDREWSM